MITTALAGFAARDAAPSRFDGSIALISENRPYAHDEALYDSQYRHEEPDPMPGYRLVDIVRQQGLRQGGRALEIGCGTGRLSYGLGASNFFDEVVVTDGSLSFLRLTERNLSGLKTASAVRLALLSDEDIGRIEAGYFDLVAMRSVLHHVTDYRGFMATLFGKLRPGAVVCAYEPRAELFLWMVTVASLLPAAAQKAGIVLTEADLGHVENFVRTMQFYLRRDIDKSDAEDKYAFWTTELLALGAEHGCIVSFESETNSPDLISLFLDYSRYCMSFPPDFVERASTALADLRETLGVALSGQAAPDLAGWYVFRKVA